MTARKKGFDSEEETIKAGVLQGGKNLSNLQVAVGSMYVDVRSSSRTRATWVKEAKC